MLVEVSPLAVRPPQDARAATPPLVGFSFSPKAATWLGEDPEVALPHLLTTLAPDLVRLPVYWDAVEPAEGSFNYSPVESMLSDLRDYNLHHPSRPARAILEIGMRNMGYPELYVPTWVPVSEQGDPSLIAVDPAYRTYLLSTLTKFRSEPLLYSWQLENEPLDDVPTVAGSQVDIPGEMLQDEIATLRQVDPRHPVVVTTYDSSTLSLDLAGLPPNGGGARTGPLPAGHPLQALQLGDALGVDLYVVTGSTRLSDASAQKRIAWKTAALDYWAAQAQASNKPLWITEMQGMPWPGHTDFTPENLLYSARRYRSTGASVILLWGVESWLQSPSWLAAGARARGVLGA